MRAMNTSLPVIRVVLLVWISAASLAFAQGIPSVPGGVRRQLLPPNPNVGQSGNGEAPKLLSSNYRITFSGKSGEKALGELSCLTSSPTVGISGPLDDSATPTSFDVRGTITEREGGLVFFEYQIGFQVPVASAVSSTPPNGKVPGPSFSNIQYHNHSCSGSILMKPGKAYEILKAGGCSHTVMIAPEVEK